MYQEKLKDQNVTIQNKDQTINKQKLGLDDLSKELDKQYKMENETMTKLNNLWNVQV